MMKLDKLPSIIENTEFDENGLAVTPEGLLVPAYVGSYNGFESPYGVKFLNNEIYPELLKRKILPLCPFTACAEYLDFSGLNDEMHVRELKEFWDNFNRIVGPVNYETLMPRSKFMIAILEGNSPDPGLCAEVGYYAKAHGPVIGIRSNIHPAENISAPINPAVRYFLDTGPYNGLFFSGPLAYEHAFDGIEKIAAEIILNSTGK